MWLDQSYDALSRKMLLPPRATGKDWCEFSSKKTFRPGRSREGAAIVKICRSFVSGFQKNPARRHGGPTEGRGTVMMKSLADHGLPLVQLKEQRRDLVVALQKRNGPINGWELMQIAAVQQAISAFEDVIADLDAEMEAAA
jgi:hypothetical protein